MRGETPKVLKNKPFLYSSFSLYINTFFYLFSGQPIPLQDIVIYSEMIGFYDVHKMVVILKQLENTVINHHNKKIKSKPDGRFNNNNKKPRSNPRG